MLFPTPEENKVIVKMLDGCGGLEYDFYETLQDGTVIKYEVKLRKTEVKPKGKK